MTITPVVILDWRLVIGDWGLQFAAIWLGHRFNTVMHGVFSVTWIHVTAVFAAALWTVVAAPR